jgi:phospholipase/lecithinase/hemolysin
MNNRISTFRRPGTRACAAALAALLLVLAAPAWAASGRRADLSRLVVIGDSLAAGYQNSSLVLTHQPDGFASLVAAQAGVELPLPLIGEPGIPPELFVDPGTGQIVRKDGFGWRVNPQVQAFDLAVPASNAADSVEGEADGMVNGLAVPTDFTDPTYLDQVQAFLATLLGSIDPSDPLQVAAVTRDLLTELILGTPPLPFPVEGTQVGMAEALAPTTVLVWLGANDLLWPAITGGLVPITDPAAFADTMSEVMDRMAATGATVVVANLPDVTVAPYLTSFEEVAAALGLDGGTVSFLLGIFPGDYVTPDAMPLIQAILTGGVPGSLPDVVVLDADEVADIRAATDAFNATIASEARSHGAALADIHALMQRIDTRGVVVGGHRLTSAFGGGVFTLDGLHPTNTAQAIIANAFIGVLNSRGAGIPPVKLTDVLAADPLVAPDTGVPPRALGHMSPAAVAAIRALGP